MFILIIIVIIFVWYFQDNIKARWNLRGVCQDVKKQLDMVDALDMQLKMLKGDKNAGIGSERSALVHIQFNLNELMKVLYEQRNVIMSRRFVSADTVNFNNQMADIDVRLALIKQQLADVQQNILNLAK